MADLKSEERKLDEILDMKIRDFIPHIAKDPDFRKMIKMCDDLLTSKGADYEVGNLADRDRARLSNFYAEAADLDLSPFKVLGVYMHKHQRAIDKFLAKGKVESEPIEGRIADNVNYLLLLWKLVSYERRQAREEKPVG